MGKLFLKRIFWKSGPPIHLIWFITARCNLRCLHCFYRTVIESAKDEFSFDEIAKTINNLPPLLSIVLTGGEPFLRKDLSEIVGFIAKKRLTENISLYTNGYDTENILTTTEKILNLCPKINFFIGASIDGYEAAHDKYREKKGSYKNACDTINGLKKLGNTFPDLHLGINTTLHRENQHSISDFRKDIYSKFKINPSITLIRGDAKSSDLKNVDANIYKKILNEIESNRKNSKHNTLLETIVDTRATLGDRLAYNTFTTSSRSYDCYAGSLMGIIYENGDVYPCEILKNSKLGNLRDVNYDINKIWNSSKANEVRKGIKRRDCFCTYECQYTCNTLYNPKFLYSFAKDALKQIVK